MTIVSKRPDGRYVSKGSKLWLKCKTFAMNDFEILGIEKSSTGIPIALLADGDAYVGNAMITLRAKEREQFWKAIDALGTPKARLHGLHKRKATWIRPGLVATVRHFRGEEKLRHATLTSVRAERD